QSNTRLAPPLPPPPPPPLQPGSVSAPCCSRPLCPPWGHRPLQLPLTCFSSLFVSSLASCFDSCLTSWFESCLVSCLVSCFDSCLGSCFLSCLVSCFDSCLASCFDCCLASCLASCFDSCLASCLDSCLASCLDSCLASCFFLGERALGSGDTEVSSVNLASQVCYQTVQLPRQHPCATVTPNHFTFCPSLRCLFGCEVM
uniref:Uncharacterized protein n=1 Tax=Stegastes partitus TaxID=144197 RepID=A0A3B4ZY00_9TELE